LLNLNISTNDLFKRLRLNVGVNNILNTKYSVIQPYYGGHAPLPVNDRQITFGAIYTL
jgi:outer membrane receptor protein involved in Fe transport